MNHHLESVRSCITHGDFILHSGQSSTWLCDLLLKWPNWFALWAYALEPSFDPVGIELGGLLLVNAGFNRAGFIRKDGTYYPRTDSHVVSLFDDVVTTERSLTEASMALDKLGIEVGEFLCVLDRRKPGEKILEVRSLVTAADLGLE